MQCYYLQKLGIFTFARNFNSWPIVDSSSILTSFCWLARTGLVSTFQSLRRQITAWIQAWVGSMGWFDHAAVTAAVVGKVKCKIALEPAAVFAVPVSIGRRIKKNQQQRKSNPVYLVDDCCTRYMLLFRYLYLRIGLTFLCMRGSRSFSGFTSGFYQLATYISKRIK